MRGCSPQAAPHIKGYVSLRLYFPIQISRLHYQSLDLMGEGEESTVTQDDYKPTTVVVPPVKRRDESAADAKKVRDREYQRMKRAQKKRSTVASDDESVTSAAGRKPVKRARTSTVNDDD